MIYYLKATFIIIQNLCIQFKKRWKISPNNLMRNVTKVKNIEKEIAGNKGKKICCITKSRRNWKQVKRKKVNLINVFKGWGWNIFNKKYLLCSVIAVLSIIFLIYFFSLIFVCGYVISFCYSFVFFFWCYLIKNEINITKKNNKKTNKHNLIY